MNILLSTLKEEFRTVKKLEKRYLQKLKALPKGSFIVRKVGQKQYGYLTQRKSGKVRQEYLGLLDEKSVKKHRDLKDQKRNYKDQLKSVREQKKILQRALRGKAA